MMRMRVEESLVVYLVESDILGGEGLELFVDGVWGGGGG